MNPRTPAIATIAVIAVLVLGAIAWYALKPSHELQSASQAPAIGKAALGGTAPQFEVSTTAGLFDLSKTTKPVFLEVFATWCPHCQRETAVIDKLFAAYGSRVAFVGVSGSDTAMDHTSAATQNDVLQWAQQFDVKYPVAYDPLQAVADLYLQGAFPTLCVIDRHKKIVYLDAGEISYGVLAAALEKALKS